MSKEKIEKINKASKNTNKIKINAILAVITLILSVGSGFILSLASLAKSQASYLHNPINKAVAVANGFDMSFSNSFFNIEMLYLVLSGIAIVLLISLYGGRNRTYYLAEYSFLNAVTMVVMNFLFIQKTVGIEAYSISFNNYFWIIMIGVIYGSLSFAMLILIFQVTHFKRLEEKGIVLEDGTYIFESKAEQVLDENGLGISETATNIS